MASRIWPSGRSLSIPVLEHRGREFIVKGLWTLLPPPPRMLPALVFIGRGLPVLSLSPPCAMEMQILMNYPGVGKAVTAIPGVPAKFYPGWNKSLIVLHPWILPKVIQECRERRWDGWGRWGPWGRAYESEPLSPARKVVFSRQELSNLGFQIGKERNPPLQGQNGGLAGKRASATPFFKVNFYWNMLVYNVLLISAVQQNESVIHVCTLRFYSVWVSTEC